MCVVASITLAFVWRQLVVPLILFAKKHAPNDPEEFLELLKNNGVPTSLLDNYLKQVEWLLLYLAGMDTWLLIGLAVTVICGVEICCNVPTRRKQEFSTGDAELDRQMTEIEQSLDELNSELDELQVASFLSNTEISFLMIAERSTFWK